MRFARSSSTVAERTERGSIVRKKMMKREDAIGEVC